MLRSVLLLSKNVSKYFTFKFGTIQVHENGISLRKWSCGTAYLRTLEGTLVSPCGRQHSVPFAAKSASCLATVAESHAPALKHNAIVWVFTINVVDSHFSWNFFKILKFWKPWIVTDVGGVYGKYSVILIESLDFELASISSKTKSVLLTTFILVPITLY